MGGEKKQKLDLLNLQKRGPNKQVWGGVKLRFQLCSTREQRCAYEPHRKDFTSEMTPQITHEVDEGSSAENNREREKKKNKPCPLNVSVPVFHGSHFRWPTLIRPHQREPY